MKRKLGLTQAIICWHGGERKEWRGTQSPQQTTVDPTPYKVTCEMHRPVGHWRHVFCRVFLNAIGQDSAYVIHVMFRTSCISGASDILSVLIGALKKTIWSHVDIDWTDQSTDRFKINPISNFLKLLWISSWDALPISYRFWLVLYIKSRAGYRLDRPVGHWHHGFWVALRMTSRYVTDVRYLEVLI
jgi:hypothetical protein